MTVSLKPRQWSILTNGRHDLVIEDIVLTEQISDTELVKLVVLGTGLTDL